MKKNFTISIPSPCSEKWDSFAPAANGGFCSACNKVVVDFTAASDSEIAAFFSAKPKHACGRFRADQMKAYSHRALPRITPGFTLLKAGVLSLLVMLTSKQASAQNIPAKANTEIESHPNRATTFNAPTGLRVTGVVTDKTNMPFPGVNVLLKGSTTGTTADAEGRFEFPQELKEGDVLLFSFIGYETREYVVPNKISNVLQITMSMQYLEMMGAVALVDEQPEPKPSALRRFWNNVKSIF